MIVVLAVTECDTFQLFLNVCNFQAFGRLGHIALGEVENFIHVELSPSRPVMVVMANVQLVVLLLSGQTEAMTVSLENRE